MCMLLFELDWDNHAWIRSWNEPVLSNDSKLKGFDEVNYEDL